MKHKAVITGDIVHSRELEDLQVLLKVLKETVSEIEKEQANIIHFETYRGDSFQMLVNEPEQAMRIAVLIRCKLRSATQAPNNAAFSSLESLWDARISIGIGRVNQPAQKVVESTGEAFELSGNQLDRIKGSQDRICLTSAWQGLNRQFEVLAKLSDAIISRWTLNSSEAAYRYLLFKETQQQIAKALGISQPAVHKRLSIANVDAVEMMLNYLHLTIKEQLHGN